LGPEKYPNALPVPTCENERVLAVPYIGSKKNAAVIQWREGMIENTTKRMSAEAQTTNYLVLTATKTYLWIGKENASMFTCIIAFKMKVRPGHL
jgi:hypothetical protein